MSVSYRYKAVEAALASAFFIESDNMGAFRGRITNLRKFGITPQAPKKGAPIEYSFQDVAILAFCLSLTEIGLDPASVTTVFSICYSVVLPHLNGEDGESEDQIFCFHGNAMSRVFAGNMGPKAFLSSVVRPASKANYNEIASIFSPMSPELAMPHMQFVGSRICMINLSHIRRQLMEYLEG